MFLYSFSFLLPFFTCPRCSSRHTTPFFSPIIYSLLHSNLFFKHFTLLGAYYIYIMNISLLFLTTCISKISMMAFYIYPCVFIYFTPLFGITRAFLHLLFSLKHLSSLQLQTLHSCFSMLLFPL